MSILEKLDRIIEVTGNKKFIGLKEYYNKNKRLTYKQIMWVERFYYSLFEKVEDEIEYDNTLYGYDI